MGETRRCEGDSGYGQDVPSRAIINLPPHRCPNRSACSVWTGVGAVEAVERREEVHPQVVAQAEGGATGFDEFFEELAGLAEPGTKVEEPAGLRPLEEDAVAADFPRGGTV